jgi:hypothetical protein
MPFAEVNPRLTKKGGVCPSEQTTRRVMVSIPNDKNNDGYGEDAFEM